MARTLELSPEDILARLTRALEALRDGDRDFGEQMLDDLAHELWQAIETRQKAA